MIELKTYLVQGKNIEPYFPNKYIKICLLSDLDKYLKNNVECNCIGVEELKEICNGGKNGN